MPELPEVQTIAADIAPRITGRRIRDVTVRWPAHIARPDPERFRALLTGLTIHGVTRRGKYVVIGLSNGSSLLIHLKMTGRLRVLPSKTPDEPHEHTVLHLEPDLDLRFHDYRKFGRLHLTDDTEAILGGLGPEPVGRAFTARALGRRLEGRRGRLKPLLLDQGFLAGLGNIYADEALWRARLHPLRTADSLTGEDIRALHRAVRHVLRTALGNRGTTFSTYIDGNGRAGENLPSLHVYGRQGEPCPRCRAPIVRLVIGGRGSHVCPRCQPQPPAAKGSGGSPGRTGAPPG